MADYDVAIIGGGPGGYVAGIRAGQLGLKTVLFDQERVGGLCLNWGCIPSKALLRNAEIVKFVRDANKWGIGGVEKATFDLAKAYNRSREVVDRLVGGVETLLKDAGVEVVIAKASLKDRNTISAGGKTYSTKNIVIATGASSRMLPGVKVDGKTVITSREGLAFQAAPERVVIIGAGPIGVEFAELWSAYGSQVTIVELLDTLVPQEDPDVGRALRRSFEQRGVQCFVKTKVDGAEVKDGVAHVTITSEQGEQTIEAETVLVAIGFVPSTSGLNLEAAGVATQRGFVTIDDQMQTNVPGIYAIGDVTGKLMLAHAASQQGIIAAETIAGQKMPVLDYVQIPRATFCQPQVGSIGYTEAAAKEAGYDVKTARFPLSANSKSVAYGETEGFVKFVVDVPTGQVLGIHMLGHDIVELLGEATMISLLEATTKEIGFAVHAHPTFSEAMKEAALAADGEAIHIVQRKSSQATPRQGAATR